MLFTITIHAAQKKKQKGARKIENPDPEVFDIVAGPVG